MHMHLCTGHAAVIAAAALAARGAALNVRVGRGECGRRLVRRRAQRSRLLDRGGGGDAGWPRKVRY